MIDTSRLSSTIISNSPEASTWPPIQWITFRAVKVKLALHLLIWKGEEWRKVPENDQRWFFAPVVFVVTVIRV